MKPTDINEVECENCGTVHETHANEIEVCEECCQHENTETELTGEYCMDCGAQVDNSVTSL